MPLTITSTTVPANSQFVVVFDSTRGLQNSQASIATGAAGLIPGARRSQWARSAVEFTALCTTQNVTLLQQILTGVAGAAADWETQGAGGSITITAATTSTGEWKPLAADFRLVVQAGATGPATCVVKAVLTRSDDYGA